MESIIDNLTEQQRKDLINALKAADDILESGLIDPDDVEEYHGTQFYEGLYDLMYRLGVWC